MKNPVHPGKIIKGSLDKLGLSVTDAAHVLGVARPTLSRILNGRGAVSPEMAVRLSKGFGSTPDFWLRLQFNYDIAKAMANADKIKVQRYAPSHSEPSTTND
jgi:addiction module HigA family antidote